MREALETEPSGGYTRAWKVDDHDRIY
jgi:hypothetical protein